MCLEFGSWGTTVVWAFQVRRTVEQRQGECGWAFRIVHIWLCHLLAHDLGRVP